MATASNPEEMLAEMRVLQLEEQLEKAGIGEMKLKNEIKSLTSVRNSLLKTVRSLEDEAALMAEIQGADVYAPAWATPRKKNNKHRASALLMLTDCHFDEVVMPREVSGMNKFNREIAESRLKATVEHAIKMARELLSGFKWEGMVLLLGGDMFSGNIHEELAQTNESVSPIEAVDHWIDPMCAAVETLRQEFGKVHIVGVVGNHGRNTRKPRMKGRVRDNFDWLMYRMMIRHFNDSDPTGITWNIPDSADAFFEVYGQRFCLTHGDQAKGGSGISGLLTPVSLLDHRKRKREQAARGGYNHMWIGHWHQYLTVNSVTVAGSLKGYDEYAFNSNFSYEEPSQPFAVLTPEHGVTMQMPVFSRNPKAEGWNLPG